jgi:hypothetical protein
MAFFPVTGVISSVVIQPSRADCLMRIQFTADPGGIGPGYIAFWTPGKFTVDGKALSFPELMSWLVESSDPVTVTLHQDSSKYMAVRQAEFTRPVPAVAKSA